MKVTTCIGDARRSKGPRETIKEVQELIGKNGLDDKVDLNGSSCSGNCVNGVCAMANGQLFSLKPEDTKEFSTKEIRGRL